MDISFRMMYVSVFSNIIKAEGEKQKSFEIARNMKSANLPIESIMQFTSLSKEEIEKL